MAAYRAVYKTWTTQAIILFAMSFSLVGQQERPPRALSPSAFAALISRVQVAAASWTALKRD